jgi:3-hydroxyisobutyrate dehydrogenase-like beta-hydroxyacid dehydrogenase
VRATRAALIYADCNAVAPDTTRLIGEIVSAAGARYVDGGIIGSPPRADNDSPRVYVSGDAAPELAQLVSYGLDVRVVSDTIGHASGLKMCYACLTKGLTALATELLVCAERLGLSDALHAEQESSQASLLKWIERSLPSMPPKAHRWVGEMEEIAATLAAVGLPPGMLLGAADVYRWVAQTPLGHETPEARPSDRGAVQVVKELAEPMPAR